MHESSPPSQRSQSRRTGTRTIILRGIARLYASMLTKALGTPPRVMDMKVASSFFPLPGGRWVAVVMLTPHRRASSYTGLGLSTAVTAIHGESGVPPECVDSGEAWVKANREILDQ
jgi:hypothetical protein